MMEKDDRSEEIKNLYDCLHESDAIISVLMSYWIATVSGKRFEQYRDQFEAARVKRRLLLTGKLLSDICEIKDK